MSKQCPYCGAELAKEASFCPYCCRSLIEKQKVKPPMLWKKKGLLIFSVFFLVGLVCFTLFLMDREPEKQMDASTISQAAENSQGSISAQSSEIAAAETYYIAENEKQYRIWVNFSDDENADERKYFKIPENEEKYGTFPTVLHISYNGDPMVWEEFMDELVETVTLTAYPQDGAKMLTMEQPAYEPIQFSAAARKADITCSANNVGINLIRWTLTMKNGDVIILEQTVEFEVMEIKGYHWEVYPMNTMDELRTLLNRLEVTASDEEVIEIYLPPVTYEGELTLTGRSYIFYGSTDENGRTTFTDTILSRPNGPHKMEFHDICFKGDGGTAIDSQENNFFYECEFSGWDIAVHAKDDGWAQSNSCVYFNNQIALLFDCGKSGGFGPSFPNNLFENNGIGLQIKATPNGRTLEFTNSVFRNNEVNIDNQIDHPLNLSRATLENN